MDITKVQLGEPVTFIGVAYRTMGEKSCITKAYSAWVTIHRAGSLELLNRLQAAQQVGECPFQLV